MKLNHFINSSIARKLASFVILLSSCFTFCITTYQVYSDYQYHLQRIHGYNNLLRQSYRESLVNALWHCDRNQIRILLKGINNLPEIENASIKINDKITFGKKSSHAKFTEKISMPLFYDYQGRREKLGTMLVVFSFDEVYRRLFHNFFITLISNFVKTFVVLASFLFFIQYFVTRHLHNIAHFIKNSDIIHNKTPFQLERRPGDKEHWDELDDIVVAINSMISNLQHSVQAVQESKDAIIRSEIKYKSLVYNIPGLVYRSNQDWSAEIVSGCETFCGYSNAEFNNKTINWTKIIYFDDREKVLSDYKKQGVALTQKPTQLIQTYRIVTKDGNIRWVEDRKLSIFEEQEFSRIDGVVFDITERINAEKVIKNREDQLRQARKMETIGVLAGGVAHEFNNLLYVISGNTELLLTQNQDQAQEMLQEILDATQKGADLVKQIMAFSRKSETCLQTIDLNAVVEKTSKMLGKLIPKMIKIKMNLADDLFAVNADQKQIEQILINFTFNAKDAMPDGGELVFKTSNIVIEQYHGDTQQIPAGQYVVLSVLDTGEGMDQKTRECIFDPFYTTKEVGQGTGMGLSVVYGIVQTHNGFVTCESALMAGTVFKVFFPAVLKISKDKSENTIQNETMTTEDSDTILIVDDEETIVQLTCSMLEDFGYKTIPANCGEVAIDLYARHNTVIDLVILDLDMPGMGGFNCLKKLMEFEPCAKVIMTSGYSSEDLINDLVDHGAQGFIAKPYKRADLSKAIWEVLYE